MAFWLLGNSYQLLAQPMRANTYCNPLNLDYTYILKVIPSLNMQAICDYAKSQGVRIHLWTNWKPHRCGSQLLG